MSLTQFHCPECSRLLHYSDPVPCGSTVKCVFCLLPVTVPDADSLANAPPPSAHVRQVIAARLSETSDEEMDPPRGEPDNFASPIDDLSPDYRIELGRWLHHARVHWSSVVGPTIGFLFVYVLLSLIPLLGLFLAPALAAGFTAVALAQLRGRPWSFATFFDGFRDYGSLLGNTLLWLLLGVVLLAPAYAAVVLIDPASSAWTWAWVGLVVCEAIYLYLVIRLEFFTIALILDRRLGPIEAMMGSWRLTRGHFVGLLGVSLILGLIAYVGLLLLGVGLLLAIPFVCLAQAAGYLLATGRTPVALGREERAQVVDLEHAGRVHWPVH